NLPGALSALPFTMAGHEPARSAADAAPQSGVAAGKGLGVAGGVPNQAPAGREQRHGRELPGRVDPPAAGVYLVSRLAPLPDDFMAFSPIAGAPASSGAPTRGTEQARGRRGVPLT